VCVHRAQQLWMPRRCSSGRRYPGTGPEEPLQPPRWRCRCLQEGYAILIEDGPGGRGRPGGSRESQTQGRTGGGYAKGIGRKDQPEGTSEPPYANCISDCSEETGQESTPETDGSVGLIVHWPLAMLGRESLHQSIRAFTVMKTASYGHLFSPPPLSM